MKESYLETEEGVRRFKEKEIYSLTLEFQKNLKEHGVAWHNVFSNECTVDFCCCEGDGNYKYHLPSYRSVVKQALQELFEECKHGDQDHQDWLENKFKQYLRDNY